MENEVPDNLEMSDDLVHPHSKRLKVSHNIGLRDENKPDGECHAQLSKRQQKKILKKEKWLEYKPVKRAREKERRKQLKAEAHLKNELGISRKILKRSTMAESCCKVRVAIDLSFDDLMNDKGLSKCIKQVGRCYSVNRRSQNPMQLFLTSFNGKSKENMEKNLGYENWDVHFVDENYLDTFKTEDIVYLCSESNNVLQSLSDDKVYIIGGLVDHNSCKGLTLRLAEEHNIYHCQLPIQDYLDMKTRKVLTIDHVFEILLRVSEGMPWKDAFLSVLPARKGAVERTSTEEETH